VVRLLHQKLNMFCRPCLMKCFYKVRHFTNLVVWQYIVMILYVVFAFHRSQKCMLRKTLKQ